MWIYWPSFNGGTAADGDAQQRAVINTYLALCACTVTTFAVSAMVNDKKKWAMEHLQNATLAGGVAVGAVADMILTPFGAITMGTVAGLVSTLGFQYVQPFLAEKMKIPDTCGVNNLHGMPSILGGILSILIAGIASKKEYEQFNVDGNVPERSSLFEIFPLNNENDSEWEWTPGYQAGMQALGIVVTLAIAIVGGIVTGFIIKIVRCFEESIQERHNKTQEDLLYSDALYFLKESYENEEQGGWRIGQMNGGFDTLEMENKS